jgi:hypothetical protein
MRDKPRLILLAGLALVLLAGSIGVTSGSSVDRESSAGNTFAARTSTLWKQTTQTDFEAGVPNNVDTSSSPGDVVLSANSTSGTIASQVLDSGVAGARWDALFWDETLQSSTNVTIQMRASDTSFAKGDATPLWISVGEASPLVSGLPSGRYKQWQATLTASDTSRTPSLNEVRVYYH